MCANAGEEVGHIVFLSSEADRNAPVYIGWAPRGRTGVTRLKANLRKQSPQIETMYVRDGTVMETVELRMALRDSWIGSGEWFTRSDQMNSYLEALREREYEWLLSSVEEGDSIIAEMLRLDGESEDAIASMLGHDDSEEIVQPKPARFTRQRGRKVSRYKSRSGGACGRAS